MAACRLAGNSMPRGTTFESGAAGTSAGRKSGPHLATERTGTVESREGQTLRLTTDLGSVHIVNAGRGARTVQYRVHIETDARGAFGQRLLDEYSLSAKATN